MSTKHPKFAAVPVMALMMLVSGAFHDAAASESDWDWTDARREGAIWSSFALNRHLNPFSFDIEVSDGEATLHGTVDEDVKRDLAGAIALSVEGVDSVSNNIEVEPAHIGEEESRARTFEQRVTDATATAAVKSKLLWNRNLRGLDIQVRTEDGVTTLSGMVGSEEERALANRLARNTRGVDDVRNELTIEPELERPVRDAVDDATATLSDVWISTKVTSSLVFTQNVRARAIQVSTDDGVVELIGLVDSSAERELAVEVAEGIRGVQRVDATNLVVRQ